jgi:hypothetical protein
MARDDTGKSRQINDDSGSFSWFRFQVDMTLMFLDNRVTKGKPQAHPFLCVFLFGGKIGVKNLKIEKMQKREKIHGLIILNSKSPVKPLAELPEILILTRLRNVSRLRLRLKRREEKEKRFKKRIGCKKKHKDFGDFP